MDINPALVSSVAARTHSTPHPNHGSRLPTAWRMVNSWVRLSIWPLPVVPEWREVVGAPKGKKSMTMLAHACCLCFYISRISQQQGFLHKTNLSTGTNTCMNKNIPSEHTIGEADRKVLFQVLNYFHIFCKQLNILQDGALVFFRWCQSNLIFFSKCYLNFKITADWLDVFRLKNKQFKINPIYLILHNFPFFSCISKLKICERPKTTLCFNSSLELIGNIETDP